MDNRPFFDRWAHTYDTHLPRFPEYRELVSRILDVVAVDVRAHHEPHILDVGIGTGIIATLVNAQCPCAVFCGLDASREMMKRIETRSFRAIDLYEADIAGMPFVENQFDVIYSNFTIHHAVNKEKVFEDIHRFVKPSGTFVLGEVVVDVPHSDEQFLEHVIERWGLTAQHALRLVGRDAAVTELEVMRMVYERKGEYLETASAWSELLQAAGFRIREHHAIDSKLGYHLWVCQKSGPEAGAIARNRVNAMSQPKSAIISRKFT